MANKPRKITSFNDPKLERQFEEILRFEREYAKRIEKTEEEVKEIKEPEEKRRPNKPTELTAFPSFKLMNVSWNYVSSNNVSYYVLSYSESTDDESTWSDWNNIKLSNVSFYIHENLDPDIDYRYRVAAVSNEGYRSKWSDIYIAGKPGKVSLSEEVAGELIGDYLADGAITESKFDETVVEKYVHEEDDTANISIIGKTADEISSTVAEVYDGGTISGSTIQQNADAINLRVVALDEDGNPTDVNAQLNISQVDEDGYIYIGGDQITLDGDTDVEGDFELNGDALINGSIKASKYKEIRNVLPWNFSENLDSNNPLPVDFHIPSETDNIVKILVSAKADSFRAYSKGASGGKHSHDVEIDPHSHDIDTDGDFTETYTEHTNLSHDHDVNGHTGDESDHDHSYDYINPDNTTGPDDGGTDHDHSIGASVESNTTDGDGRHDHSSGSLKTDTWYDNDETGHRHLYPRFDTTKEKTSGVSEEERAHNHNLDFGIYRDTAEFEQGDTLEVELWIDNGNGFGSEPFDTLNADSDGILTEDIDITNEITLDNSNFKQIEFRISNSVERTRISGQLIAKLDITA